MALVLNAHRDFDYLTGMPYLLVLPSLICGTALSVEDIRSRNVPRVWVAYGTGAQCVVFMLCGALVGRPWLFAQALPFAVLAAVLQFALSRMKPGALGFGDVTSSFMAGQAVGSFGVQAFIIWWLSMGVLGLLWMGLWQRFGPRRGTDHAGEAPFVPVIVAAGVLACVVTIPTSQATL